MLKSIHSFEISLFFLNFSPKFSFSLQISYKMCSISPLPQQTTVVSVIQTCISASDIEFNLKKKGVCSSKRQVGVKELRNAAHFRRFVVLKVGKVRKIEGKRGGMEEEKKGKTEKKGENRRLPRLKNVAVASCVAVPRSVSPLMRVSPRPPRKSSVVLYSVNPILRRLRRCSHSGSDRMSSESSQGTTPTPHSSRPLLLRRISEANPLTKSDPYGL